MNTTTNTTTITDTKAYRIMIFGGRDFNDYERMKAIVLKGVQKLPKHTPVAIVSGTARGADRLGERLAAEMGWQVFRFPADWNKYGKRAGIVRNEQMADFCDEGLAFWDGSSRGTAHNISFTSKLHKPCTVIRY